LLIGKQAAEQQVGVDTVEILLRDYVAICGFQLGRADAG
jgi:hypothetical protein